MAELTEQQSHLKNLLEQRAGLVAEINELNSMSQRNKKVIDGKGTSRINKIIFSKLIKL